MLNITLLPHQEVAVEWMTMREHKIYENCRGGLLADDMGLGKTISTLSIIAQDNFPGTLIVAPISLLQQWKKEIEEKVCKRFKIGIYHGFKRSDMDLSQFDIVLTTYACLAREHPQIPHGTINRREMEYQLQKSSEKHYGTLLKHNWRRVVLDEAHFIRNMNTRVAYAARALKATFRWALSGTPIQNNKKEIKSIASFLCNDIIKFNATFILQKLTLRRVKEEILTELPAKETCKHFLKLSDKEQAIYQVYENKAQKEYKRMKSGRSEMMEVLVAILRMRQICDSVQILENDFCGYSTKHKKINRLLRKLEPTGDKIIVFSTFTTFLDIVGHGLDALKWKYSKFTGKLSMHQRDKILEDFNNNPTTNILLMSTKAGNVGLNLVSANHVILCEPWWNPFVDEQAQDRVHRIGQEKHVIVHRLYVKNSIEDRILMIQDAKAKMFSEVFDKNLVNSSMTMNEMQFLVGL